MVQDLRTAADVESALKMLDNKIESAIRRISGAGGYVASHRPVADVSFTTTEKVVSFVVTSLTQGRRYKVTWSGDIASGSGTAAAYYKLRYIAGNLPTSVGGTAFIQRDTGGVSGSALPLDMVGDFVAPTTGDYTISATFGAYSNTAVVLGTGVHTPILLLEDIGV